MERNGMRAAVALLTTAIALAGAVGTPAHAAPTPSPSASATPRASATAAPRATATPRRAATAPPGPVTAPTPPPPVGRALAARLLDAPVLTLPADDGLRDRVRLRVVSGAAGRIDVVARRGKRVVPLAAGVALRRTATGWQRSVAVPIGPLKQGTWTLVARRSDDTGVRSPVRLVVGSGLPVSVAVTPVSRSVQPYRDGALDGLDADVVALDETGAALPVRGTLRLDAGKRHRTRTLQSGRTRIPVTGLPLGAGLLTARITTPSGEAERTAAVVLAPTAVGALRLARSSDTVQPVSDGLLDSVVLTTSGAASGQSSATVSGTLTVAGAAGVVQSWPVPDGAPRSFEWDGRVKGAIVPGVYTATLTLRGPEGRPRTTVKTLTVTSGHLPYRVRDLFTVADGNQQGLAVHDGIFYVGYDNQDGTSRIERYDEHGNRFPLTLGPLAIGHAAELAFSTTNQLLYAVNGGAKNPTTVWALEPQAADGPSALRATYDLSRLGSSGMIAVDDANGRLLVFAGSAGAYTITPMTLADVTTTGADGTSSTVPAGTLGASVPITIQGVPQGMEVVGDRLWVYTSLKNRNRVAEYDLGTAVLDVGSDVDLMNPGEGEGLASRVGPDGTTWMIVGTHSTNRISVLEPVVPE